MLYKVYKLFKRQDNTYLIINNCKKKKEFYWVYEITEKNMF